MKRVVQGFRNVCKEVKKNRMLFLMLSPAVIYTVLFSYLPMTGIILAFKNYKYNLGIFKSPWYGFENFRFLFISGTGWNITKNTILYNLLFMAVRQGLAIIIAIFISEITKKVFRKISQSIIFLPYFISWVVVGAFCFAIFDYDKGVLNNILTSLNMESVNVYTEPRAWPFILTVVDVWKGIGYSSIMYIAAITGVDRESYEAAAIDGANIFQRIWYVTLPGIKGTVVTLLLLQVGSLLRGNFSMFYQLIRGNGQLFNATDIIDTYVFRAMLGNSNMGMTAAATFYQSVLCFVTIVTVNAIVKRIDSDNALF